jgi:hypothetical protein
MSLLHAIAYVIVIAGVLAALPDGGWRVVLPVLAWTIVGLTLAGRVDALVPRLAGFALTLAGAFLLSRRLSARYDASRPNRSRTRR